MKSSNAEELRQAALSYDKKALIGLVCILVGCAVAFVTIVIPNVLRARIRANEASAVGMIRTLNTVMTAYQGNYPQKGYPANLDALGPGPTEDCKSPDATHSCLLDSGLVKQSCTAGVWCRASSGYMFIVWTDASEPHAKYTITAIPERMSRTGIRNFCSTQEGILYADASLRVRSSPYTEAECKSLSPF